MGTSGSVFRNPEEDDIMGIPIEMKPRGKLAGLRSVSSSLGKKHKPPGGSLRSALSVDLENPEVERIKKEFDMYRLNKENEITNMQKKEQKLETENKRLRAELLILQKTCTKLRNRGDASMDAEHQALTRASVFETDRDKVQRQFKIFRETKECEIQNLLRGKRELENKVAKYMHGSVPEDMETTSRVGLENTLSTASNPGDWWTALESEPSLGSTLQLHQSTFKGPEFAHSMMEMDGPFINVNKEDWSTVLSRLTQTMPIIPDHVPSNMVRLYISSAKYMQHELDILQEDYLPKLDDLCRLEGRIFIPIHMPDVDSNSLSNEMFDRLLSSHKRQIESCTIFLALLEARTNRLTHCQFTIGHLDNPGSRHAVFCFKDGPTKSNKSSASEARDLKAKVYDSSDVEIVDNYVSPRKGAVLVFQAIENIIKTKVCLNSDRSAHNDDVTDSANADKATLDDDVIASVYMDNDGAEQLCSGIVWDPHGDNAQLECLSEAVKSSCQLGFEKYYERLNTHVFNAGPLPPLLVSGSPGSGKTLLLTKWLQLQQEKNGSTLVLYHFVGSESTTSADPVLMIRRITAQLIQHVMSPPALTCDPVRLVEEFPRWLEKVSSKLPSGILLILDSIDKFRQGELHLQWLLDPLPVDLRVIVSVDEATCPQAWASWPSLRMEPLSNKTVKEIIQAELATLNITLNNEDETKILTHCRTAATCNPLYVMVLARAISSFRSESGKSCPYLDILLMTSDTPDIYMSVIDVIRQEYEIGDTKGILKKILRYLYLSRNGLTEPELLTLIPTMHWNYWAPVSKILFDLLILTQRSGVMTFMHDEGRKAVKIKYITKAESSSHLVTSLRHDLIEYFQAFLKPGQVTCRVADELPWMIHQTGDKDALTECIHNLCVFQRLYAKGSCEELTSYWQYVGVDKVAMAHTYFQSVKKMEEMVDQLSQFVTLPKIADVYESLGRFLKDMALLTQALPAFQRALEIRETALDPDHPSVARSLHQLAGLHAQWGKFSTAEALYKQALEIYENAYGREHIRVAKELDALALIYQKQDRHDFSDPLRRRAVQIRKRGKSPKNCTNVLHGIDTIRRQAIRLEEVTVLTESPDMARTLNELGVLYYLQNQIDDAESFFKRSLEMRESTLSSDHPDVAQSLNNLAALYNDKKQCEKAEPLYERALSIRLKYHNMAHPSVASIVKNLAMLYRKQGKYEQAEPLYKQAVEIREMTFGASHPAVATALVNLAVLHSQQNKYLEAEPLYEHALAIYEDSFGSHHPRVAETLRNLAVMKYEQGNYEMAAKMYRRATNIKDLESSYQRQTMIRRSSSDDTNSTVKNILHT